MNRTSPTAELISLTPVPIEELQPGVRYRIVIADCCVEAEFVARFDRWEPRPARTENAGVDPYGVALFEGGARLRDLVWFAYRA